MKDTLWLIMALDNLLYGLRDFRADLERIEEMLALLQLMKEKTDGLINVIEGIKGRIEKDAFTPRKDREKPSPQEGS